MGEVVSVNLNSTKGAPKRPVDEIELIVDLGPKGDAHAAPGDRQVSLLAAESIERARSEFERSGKACEATGGLQLGPGSFAENITTRGVDLVALSPGDRLRVGEEAVLAITKIGKDCHRRCAIYYKTGDCIMPSEGVFARVERAGAVKPGDTIEKR